MANGTLAASQIEMLTQSGTGIVTIVPPTTNTNRTLTLPDSTGTLLNTNGGTITGNLTVSGIATLANNAVLGVPSSGTLTNLTGLPLTTGVTGVLPTANGGTNLSSFTSGGVVYASSSSALATGTALTFDGTSLGIGVAAPLAVLDVLGSFFNGGQSRSNSTTKTFGFRVPHFLTATSPMNVIGGLSTTSVNNVYIGGSDSNIGGTAATDLFFYTAANNTTANGTLRMSIDSSGNVGIGTASPSSFTVGGTPILVVGNNAQTQITLYGGSSTGDINFATSNSGAGLYKGVVRYDGTSNFMSFWTNSAEKMRLDSSGNLGLGITSVATGISQRVLQVTNGTNGMILLGSGATQNPNPRIFGASTYDLALAAGVTTGQMLFYTNDTQRMTLDASGNLGLGVTPVSQNGKVFQIDGGAGAADIRLTNNATGSAINNGGLLTLVGSDVYLWNLENNFLSFGTNNLERVRISSTGNITNTRSIATAYSGTNGATWTNGLVLYNSLTAATGNASLIEFAGPSNVSSVCGVVQNASGYGDFVWAGYSGTFSEKMRLNSSGDLGIGTTAPLAKLQIDSGDIRLQGSAPGKILFFSTGNGVSQNATLEVQNDGGTTNTGEFRFSTRNVATTLAERVRITAEGNLGIGTTSPDIFSRGYGRIVGINDSGSSGAALEINSASSYSAIELGRGGVRKAFFTAQSTVTEFGNLEAVPLVFYTNSVERARIDSSGNLLVGTTSTSALAAGGRGLIELNGSSDSVYSYKAAGSLVGYMLGSASEVRLASFTAIPLNFYTNNTQRMSITSTGVMYLGALATNFSFTNGSAVDISGSGTGIAGTGTNLTLGVWNGPIIFQAGNSAGALVERARISSDGTFRVKGAGTAGSTDAFQVSGSAPASAASLDSSGNLLVAVTNDDPTFNRTNGVVLKANGAILCRNAGGSDFGCSSTSGTNIGFYSDNGSARVTGGNISTNGSVTSYNVTSDRRLKQNIEPMQNGLAKVLQLKPSSYNYVEGNQYSAGFIADELQSVIPEAVTGTVNEIDEEGKPVYQSVDSSFLIPHLVKAIQEQQALITQLTARVAQLESKS